eukprot:2822140-Rhodomonas_salina.1
MSGTEAAYGSIMLRACWFRGLHLKGGRAVRGGGGGGGAAHDPAPGTEWGVGGACRLGLTCCVCGSNDAYAVVLAWRMALAPTWYNASLVLTRRMALPDNVHGAELRRYNGGHGRERYYQGPTVLRRDVRY